MTTERATKFRQIPGLLAGGLPFLFCLFLSAVSLAQVPTIDPSGFLTNPMKAPIAPVNIPVSNPLNVQLDGPFTRIPNLAKSQVQSTVNTTRLITLEEAQQAAASSNPMARLGALQVEAAKQNRQIFEASFLPQISATAANLHFNKFMGEEIQVRRPLLGTTTSVGAPLFNKDSTTAVFNLIQPLTPLLKVRQAVKIARADENIARLKAGMAVAETAIKVEKNYFALLIAQRELIVAQMRSKRVQNKYAIASNSATVQLSPEQETELLEAQKAAVLANSKMRELSASLNSLIGFPEETELQLVPPPTQVKAITLAEAMQTTKVAEAEQTAIKARAGLAVELTKAKVAAGVKTSYFEMDRSRALSELSQRKIAASRVVNASYQSDSSELNEARAKLELEMIRAELDYRDAYARLKTLMGTP